jgi:hypothetical protein
VHHPRPAPPRSLFPPGIWENISFAGIAVAGRDIFMPHAAATAPVFLLEFLTRTLLPRVQFEVLAASLAESRGSR